jgi:trimeric autotransporter adhesin
MDAVRMTRAGWLRRRVAAVVMVGLVPAAALAGASRAAAAPGGNPALAAGVISTAAGGAGGPALATRVSLGNACGVSYGVGHMYVADGGTVRAVRGGTGWLTTPAGTGAAGPLGDGGPAASASLIGTCGVVVDHSGNLVISDAGHNRVRVVAHQAGRFYGRLMTAGHIYTVAGDGRAGFSGDGGLATKAELSGLSVVSLGAGVATDGAGNLLIADFGNYRVRVVAGRGGRFYGRTMTAGHIYTIAGNGIHGFSGDGGPAAKAELGGRAGVSLGGSVAADGAGNMLIADTGNYRVRVVAGRGGRFYGRTMTAGHIYTIAGNGIGGSSGDGGPAAKAELGGPSGGSLGGGVATDRAGNLLIADSTSARIRVVAHQTGRFYGRPMTAGDIYTVAGDGVDGFSGDGGPATAAELGTGQSVAADGAGNLLIADIYNHCVRVVAESTGRFYGQAMTAGDIYTIAGNGRAAFSGDGGAATGAELGPVGVAADSAGNLLIADTGNNRVRMVAHQTGSFYGQPMTAGHIYTVAGNGIDGGFSGDGGPATAAELNAPQGVAADAAGNLLIADTGQQEGSDGGNRIRVVAASTGSFYGQAMTAGDIYTVAGNGGFGFSGDGGPASAAELNAPQSVRADAAGNLLIADTGNVLVRVVAESTGSFYGQPMTAGDIYTIAGNGTFGSSGDGGPATAAELYNPSSVTTDAAGNLVIADSGNNRLRVVAESTGSFYGQPMTAGDIYTIAGHGTPGFSGDGGPASAAELNGPQGVTADTAGNLLIADTGNQRIRVIAHRTGSFYRRLMTAGHIYTIAGNGRAGFSGDGGPATAAELNSPSRVTTDGAGGLWIADTGSNRIRLVAG